jgi:hypothetical protein
MDQGDRLVQSGDLALERRNALLDQRAFIGKLVHARADVPQVLQNQVLGVAGDHARQMRQR